MRSAVEPRSGRRRAGVLLGLATTLVRCAGVGGTDASTVDATSDRAADEAPVIDAISPDARDAAQPSDVVTDQSVAATDAAHPLPDVVPPTDVPHVGPVCTEVTTTDALVRELNADHCVHLHPGTYVVDGQLPLHPGQLLLGVDAMAPAIIVRASASFPANGATGVIRTLGSTTDDPGTIQNVTVDAANVAFLGVQGTNARLLDSQVFNARCNGVSILGNNAFEVSGCVIRYNGGSCPTAPPGAGIYVHGGTATNIHDSYLQNNVGPAIDVNSVQTADARHITHNTIDHNSGWAAISLFNTRNWSVGDNTVSHPRGTEVQPYNPGCRNFPGGFARSAAMFVCEQPAADGIARPATGLSIVRNQFVGSYGILLTGVAPDGTPRDNSVTANTVFGSDLGCADHYPAGRSDSNRYVGVTDTAHQCYAGNVTYF